MALPISRWESNLLLPVRELTGGERVRERSIKERLSEQLIRSAPQEDAENMVKEDDGRRSV